MNVAVARRISHFGLVDRRRKDGSTETAAKQAMDQRLGYELGRMFLFGRLTWAQHEAGEYFASDMARFYATSGVQFPSARTAYLATKSESDPADKQAIRSITQEDKEAIAKQAHIRAGKLRKILLEVGDINTGRKVLRIVMALLVEDRPLAPHEEELARRGLNALVRYYGVEAASAAANRRVEGGSQ